MDKIISRNRDEIEVNSEPGKERSRERVMKEEADRLIVETILENHTENYLR